MSRRARNRPGRGASATRTRRGVVLAASVGIAIAFFLLFGWLALSRPGQPSVSRPGQPTGAPTPWARLGTQDVHSLAFAPDSADHLYFGHHGGILETRDGGRTWSALPVRADAMGMRAAPDGSIVIAGHEVLTASRDGGRTWGPLRSNLPHIDIHGFTRDPVSPARMWAYLAGGGVYETRDGGTHWEKVVDGDMPFLAGTRDGLLGIDPAAGFVRSTDGGRTWTAVSRPEAYPAVSLAATPDGQTVWLGTTGALLRSEDGGRTWTRIPFPDLPLAIAVSDDGRRVAVVTKDTSFYRSDDGGNTWPGP